MAPGARLRTPRNRGCSPFNHQAGALDAPQPSRADRATLERAVLAEAELVFCTTSAAADPRLEAIGFETAVFDEAAQAGELATLVPLQHGARRVVLVGDPQQLPATVLSQEAKQRGLGRSLFERLQCAGHPVTMLRTQFRMHAAIRAFPSRHFYDDRLKDAEPISW